MTSCPESVFRVRLCLRCGSVSKVPASHRFSVSGVLRCSRRRSLPCFENKHTYRLPSCKCLQVVWTRKGRIIRKTNSIIKHFLKTCLSKRGRCCFLTVTARSSLAASNGIFLFRYARAYRFYRDHARHAAIGCGCTEAFV